MPHDILIVDDEADIRMLIAGILGDEGYQTREAHNADSAIAEVKRRQPSLVILDIWLENSRLDGLGILSAIKAEHPGVPVLMISGHGTIETAVTAIQRGAYDFIEKPFKADRLLVVVQRAIEAARLRREIDELRLRSGVDYELIGNSPNVAQVRSALERVSASNSRVMISGPAGSGKEVAARVLHKKSRRANGPFVVLNCAMLKPDRMEIELFGTETGQGGEPRKVGVLEQAHGGTLLLDEVGDLPLETQGKLVRVLQDQPFERVGGSTRVSVDVRVITASSRDLAADMTAGRFRQDLYYRLNVVPLKMPALSERREDIPNLCKYFMAKASEAAGLPSRDFGEDAMVALQAYEWPGNVRQLRNVMDWLLIMAPGEATESIHADMLPADIRDSTPAVLKWDKGAEIMSLPLRDAREVFEREYLMAQVNRFGGNISRTANFVGMERSALHRKLKSLGVHGSDKGEKLLEQ